MSIQYVSATRRQRIVHVPVRHESSTLDFHSNAIQAAAAVTAAPATVTSEKGLCRPEHIRLAVTASASAVPTIVVI